MYRHILKLNRIDTIIMRIVYIMCILIGIIYAYIIWHKNHPLTDQRIFYSTTEIFFLEFYSFAHGIIIFISSVVLRGSYKKNNRANYVPFIAIFAAVYIVVMIADIVYFRFTHEFWHTGYKFFTFEALMVSLLTRRYLFLKEMLKLMIEDHDTVEDILKINKK